MYTDVKLMYTSYIYMSDSNVFLTGGGRGRRWALYDFATGFKEMSHELVGGRRREADDSASRHWGYGVSGEGGGGSIPPGGRAGSFPPWGGEVSIPSDPRSFLSSV